MGTHLSKWNDGGRESGKFGYPTSDVELTGLLLGSQQFEGGTIEGYVEPLPFLGEPGSQVIEWIYENLPFDDDPSWLEN